MEEREKEREKNEKLIKLRQNRQLIEEYYLIAKELFEKKNQKATESSQDATSSYSAQPRQAEFDFNKPRQKKHFKISRVKESASQPIIDASINKTPTPDQQFVQLKEAHHSSRMKKFSCGDLNQVLKVPETIKSRIRSNDKSFGLFSLVRSKSHLKVLDPILPYKLNKKDSHLLTGQDSTDGGSQFINPAFGSKRIQYGILNTERLPMISEKSSRRGIEATGRNPSKNILPNFE